jgi:hypothetical protein
MRQTAIPPGGIRTRNLSKRVVANPHLGPRGSGSCEIIVSDDKKLSNVIVCTSSPNIVRVVKSRRMRWAGHVARMGEDRGMHRVLVGKPEGKRPLGRPRRRWEDNIKMDLQEVGGGRGD